MNYALCYLIDEDVRGTGIWKRIRIMVEAKHRYGESIIFEANSLQEQVITAMCVHNPDIKFQPYKTKDLKIASPDS